jgi:hypothetical protein
MCQTLNYRVQKKVELLKTTTLKGMLNCSVELFTNNNKSTTTRNHKVMGEDKKKEAERQQKIRLDKKNPKRLEAFYLGIRRKKEYSVSQRISCLL